MLNFADVLKRTVNEVARFLHLVCKKRFFMAKTILDLNHDEALDFLMTPEQYHGFELPEYFKFDTLLRHVRDTVGDKPLDEVIADEAAAHGKDVNLDFILNKDGQYGVRPLTLVNPFLYYLLARELCTESHWQALRQRFAEFAVPQVASCAMPVVPDKAEPFFRSATINNWWLSIEQRSIELSLDYRYMFVTDITNCYGSITPQSIVEALTDGNQGNRRLASTVISLLGMMQQGRNIGIPQGSTLFDFVAEVVLGYADWLLHRRLEARGITGFEVLRYRDDYRIYSNNKDELEKISYELQAVLESLGLRMNTTKTRISDNIVLDSIKQDKLDYIHNTPIFNKKGCDFDGYGKHLLYILMFAREHPNGGQVKTMLSDLDKRLTERLRPRRVKVTDLSEKDAEGNPKVTIVLRPANKLGEHVKPLCAIATQIAYENMTASHYALRVVSRLVSSLADDDPERAEIIGKVYDRLRHQPNSIYNQLWLQTLTYHRDRDAGNTDAYTMPLCRLVMDETFTLWDNSWLASGLADGLPTASIVDRDNLSATAPVINFRERTAYDAAYATDDDAPDADTDNYDFEETIICRL